MLTKSIPITTIAVTRLSVGYIIHDTISIISILNNPKLKNANN